MEKTYYGKDCTNNEFYGKWLWLLFWMSVFTNLVGILTWDRIVKIFPGMQLLGMFLEFVCSVIIGLILVKMGERLNQYRIAGVFAIGADVLSLVFSSLTDRLMMQNVALFFALPGAVCGILGMYHEYMAHASLVSSYDRELSKRWRLLWKWNMWLIVGLIGSLFLTLIIPWFGVIAVLGICVAMIVVSINMLITLYRSAQLFCRNISRKYVE